MMCRQWHSFATLKNGANAKDSAAVAVFKAEELLELIRLRFEQVGVSNPSVWGPIIADANSAQAILKKQRGYLAAPSPEWSVLGSRDCLFSLKRANILPL